LKVSGSSEIDVEAVGEGETLALGAVKRSARFGAVGAGLLVVETGRPQKTGTRMFLTNVAGDTGFATLGRKKRFRWILADQVAAAVCNVWFALQI